MPSLDASVRSTIMGSTAAGSATLGAKGMGRYLRTDVVPAKDRERSVQERGISICEHRMKLAPGDLEVEKKVAWGLAYR